MATTELNALVLLRGTEIVQQGLAWCLEQQVLLLNERAANLFHALNKVPVELEELTIMLSKLDSSTRLDVIESYLKANNDKS